jgi:flagellar hook-associated protein 3 FlgL
MRITFNSQYRDSAAGIETASQQLIEMQRQVATSKRISKPSDDPSGSASSVNERAQLATVEQYSRTADSVTSRLNVVDSVMSDIVSKLTEIQSNGHNALGSTKSDAQREAIAVTLEGIRASLLSDMNTTFHGSYVFAGAKSTTKPYTETGGVVSAYAGSTTEVDVDIAEERQITVAFNGETIAKGSAATDMFGELNNLITAIRAGNSDNMQTALTNLGDAFSRATSAQTRVGVAMNQIQAEQLRQGDTKLAGTARLSKIEDANMAEAISGMTRADAAYRAALGAAGTSAKVSLLDYLG